MYPPPPQLSPSTIISPTQHLAIGPHSRSLAPLLLPCAGPQQLSGLKGGSSTSPHSPWQPATLTTVDELLSKRRDDDKDDHAGGSALFIPTVPSIFSEAPQLHRETGTYLQQSPASRDVNRLPPGFGELSRFTSPPVASSITIPSGLAPSIFSAPVQPPPPPPPSSQHVMPPVAMPLTGSTSNLAPPGIGPLFHAPTAASSSTNPQQLTSYAHFSPYASTTYPAAPSINTFSAPVDAVPNLLRVPPPTHAQYYPEFYPPPAAHPDLYRINGIPIEHHPIYARLDVQPFPAVPRYGFHDAIGRPAVRLSNGLNCLVADLGFDEDRLRCLAACQPSYATLRQIEAERSTLALKNQTMMHAEFQRLDAMRAASQSHVADDAAKVRKVGKGKERLVVSSGSVSGRGDRHTKQEQYR